MVSEKCSVGACGPCALCVSHPNVYVYGFSQANNTASSPRSMSEYLAPVGVSVLLKKRTSLLSCIRTAPRPFKDSSVTMTAVFWVVVDDHNSIGDVFIDGVQFLLHVTGPYLSPSTVPRWVLRRSSVDPCTLPSLAHGNVPGMPARTRTMFTESPKGKRTKQYFLNDVLSAERSWLAHQADWFSKHS